MKYLWVWFVALASSTGILSAGEFGSYFVAPGNALTVSETKNKTPDDRPVMSVKVNSERDKNHLAGRQLIFTGDLAQIKLNQTYALSFYVKGAAEGEFAVVAGVAAAPYTYFDPVNEKKIAYTADWKPVRYEFTVKTIGENNTKAALPRFFFGLLPENTVIELGPVTLTPVLPDAPLSLAAVANMGFADERENDGQGGWSDQGSANDFASFDSKAKEFGGISFAVVDPAKNNGKAIISFKGGSFLNGAGAAVLDVKPVERKYLYLLHSMCFTPARDTVTGRIEVGYQDGSTQSFELKSGTDIADWWSPADIANAKVVFAQNSRGVYLSKFMLQNKPVTHIKLVTAQKGLWIVIGATLSNEEINVKREVPFRAERGKGWEVIDVDHLKVKPGSALDFSGLVDRAPAGTLGRVIVNGEGKLAFAQKPDEKVRFLSNTLIPGLAQIDKMSKEEIADWAEAVKLQGYNMVRLHFTDVWLLKQDNWPPVRKVDQVATDPDAIIFDPERVDKLDFLMSELKKRGIYFYMDLMTSYIGFHNADVYAIGTEDPYNQYLLVSAEHRQNYKAGALKWLRHVNPYTGNSLVTEPAVAVLLFCNEQDLRLDGKGFRPDIIQKAWQDFLRQKYGSDQALFQAWGGKYKDTMLDANDTIAKVPMIHRDLPWGTGQASADVVAFLQYLQKDMNQFYQSIVTESGYPGLTSQWDMFPWFGDVPAKVDFPVNSRHFYFAHPSNFTNKDSLCDQSSFLTKEDYRMISGTNIAGMPMALMELGQSFWNRYRHEQPMIFAVQGAFQDYSIQSQSHMPVLPKLIRGKLEPFNNTGLDPVIRVSEIIHTLAFLRGDVQTAKSKLNVILTDDLLLTGGYSRRMMPGPLGGCYPLSQMVLSYDQHKIDGNLNLPLQKGKEYTAKEVVDQMRQKGMLSSGNITDPDKKIYQSDTGEVVYDRAKGEMSLDTPRLKAVVVKKGKADFLADLKVAKASVPCLIAAASLDRAAAVTDAKRVLVMISTDALNSNMEFADADRVKLKSVGNFPVLLQTGNFELSLNNVNAAKFKLYPLKLDGTRQTPIPLEANNNQLKITIDTAKLPGGPAVLFELVAE